jgi:spermidine synthase
MDITPRRQSHWQFILFALFSLSGFAGLIYESIWSHYLKLFLGHAAYAQTLVLAIFMGGMALGAWSCGKLIHRLKNPLLGYVIVELVIGVLGMLFHPVFTSSTGFLLDSVLPGMESPLAIELVRWSFASLLILPQTLLLGATFPLMSVGILRNFPALPGNSIAMLYFSNSLGAVIGVLASGFWLISAVGLPGTIMTAALINFLLAFLVYAIAKQVQAHEAPAAPTTNSADELLRPLLLVALVTGLSSFVYEIGWIRMLSLVLGASTHAFELMLAAFILGLALGGLWVRKHIDRYTNPLQALGIVQLLMGLLALGTIVSYNHIFDIMQGMMNTLQRNESGYLWFNLGSHFIAALVMLPVTFMAGMTLPLITYILFSRGSGESAIGKVYAANTLGAIIGVWLAVQWLLPLTGLKHTILLGAALDLVLGIYLLARSQASLTLQRLTIIVSGVALVGVGMGTAFDSNRMASGVFRHGQIQSKDIVFHKDGHTATVDVFDSKDDVRAISTNGKPDAAVRMSDKFPPTNDEPTMALAGGIPLLLNPDIKTAAVIGMGSGISANVLLASPSLQSLDLIEIEAAMVEGAKLFGEHSHRVYNDPRSHIHIDDAKSYFASHRKQYDAIISEPSNPWVSGVANLFTDEFYSRIRHYLNDDGYLVQWFQLYETNPQLIGSILKALGQNFDDYRIYATVSSDVVLVARKHGKIPPLNATAFQFPSLRKHLERVQWFTTDDIALHEIGNRQLLEPLFLTTNSPANSDYFPYVDQHAVKARFLQQWCRR